MATQLPVQNEFDTEVEGLIFAARTNDNVTTYIVGLDIVDADPSTVPCTDDAECQVIDLSFTCCDGLTGFCTANFCAPPNGTAQDVNAFDAFEAFALAGGAPTPTFSFYDTTNQAELETALTTIAQALVPCVIPLDPAPGATQVPTIAVSIAGGPSYGAPLADATACALDDGWYWSNPNDEITLCGLACADYREVGTVDVISSCP